MGTAAPTECILYLDYKGWALILELLAGVIGILSTIGMIISAFWSEETVEPL